MRVLTRVLMRCETRQKKPISKLSLGLLKHTLSYTPAHVEEERICHKNCSLEKLPWNRISKHWCYTFRVKVLFLASTTVIVCKIMIHYLYTFFHVIMWHTLLKSSHNFPILIDLWDSIPYVDVRTCTCEIVAFFPLFRARFSVNIGPKTGTEYSMNG